jgi:16S rRNA (adenine1518-N6/adenine1519-N6)-dimethyltransferase
MKEILEKFNAMPSKRLGQNFLTDKNILRKIIAAADIKKSDIVLEVGPGTGILTAELAKRAKKVIAIEKDKKMIEVLAQALKDFKNVEVINQDILKFNIDKKYKVVANIPYYLTSALIRKFLEDKNQPSQMILMIQKEVAQRICALSPNMSMLSVSVQFYAKPEILFYVSKNSFWPAPKVDSAVIKITPHSDLSFPTSVMSFPTPVMSFPRRRESSDLFFKIVKAGFSAPRKQLAGNLSKGLKIKKEEVEKLLVQNNIDPKQRAETLSVEDWKKLTKQPYK